MAIRSTFQHKLMVDQRLRNEMLVSNGFTLIELLVVIIIIGILGAIALPSYLSQTNKARGAEAKSHLASIHRAQQSYRLEEGSFASRISNLDTKIVGKYYNYQVNGTTTSSFVATLGQTREENLKGYSAAVTQVQDNFTQVICETIHNVSLGDSAAIPSTTATPACGSTSGVSDKNID